MGVFETFTRGIYFRIRDIIPVTELRKREEAGDFPDTRGVDHSRLAQIPGYSWCGPFPARLTLTHRSTLLVDAQARLLLRSIYRRDPSAHVASSGGTPQTVGNPSPR